MSQFLTAKKSDAIQIPATENIVFVSDQPELYEVTAFFQCIFFSCFQSLRNVSLCCSRSTVLAFQNKLVGKSREHPKRGPKRKPQPVLEYGSSVWDPQSILLQNELEKVQMSVTTFPVVISYCHVCDNVPISAQLLPLSVTTFPLVPSSCHCL